VTAGKSSSCDTSLYGGIVGERPVRRICRGRPSYRMGSREVISERIERLLYTRVSIIRKLGQTQYVVDLQRGLLPFLDTYTSTL